MKIVLAAHPGSAIHGGVLILLAATVIGGGCNSTPTEPAGTDAFAVENIAVYDGVWKDPQLGVNEGESSPAIDNGVVNAIVQSPLDRNKLVVAGDFDHVRSTTNRGIAAGLVLFYLTGGFRALAEGETDVPFYLGGPYNDAAPSPSDENIYFAGSEAEASNLDHGLIGPLGRFDDMHRLWSAPHTGTLAGRVRDIERWGNELYVGGSYQRPYGLSNSANLFRYDISSGAVTSMGTGLTGTVYDVVEAIEAVDGAVIVGGTFGSIGGVPANNIARYIGGTWGPLGAGLNGYVRDILVHNGAIYAAGRFYTQDERFGICARFDGTGWTMLGPPFGYAEGETMNQGHALASYKGNVILGGRFKSIGGVSLHNIAFYDEASGAWKSLEEGGVDLSSGGGEVMAEVNALEVVSDRLYVGGRFDRARVR